jgi:hypothetical protein
MFCLPTILQIVREIGKTCNQLEGKRFIRVSPVTKICTAPGEKDAEVFTCPYPALDIEAEEMPAAA